ncbi:MAG TPA: M23 family metallopeptidase [Gammaproteobacteria bacterium]
MTRRRGVAWAGAAVAAAVACAAFGYRHGQAERLERAAAIEPALDAWRLRFIGDARRVAAERAAAERWIEDAADELSRMQASVVQLESLAERLVERSGLDGAEFDFRTEPGLGGPEETPLEPTAAEQWDAAVASLSAQIEDRRRQMSILEETLKWRDLRAAVSPEGRPVKAAYVSSRFGARIDPFSGRRALHQGIDFAGAPGTPIVAVGAGIVTWSGPRAGYGEMVEIDHGNGLVTRYAHNTDNLVEVGDVVTRGQPIARLGATGRATGPNLHFEVLQDGEAVDPLPFIK